MVSRETKSPAVAGSWRQINFCTVKVIEMKIDVDGKLDHLSRGEAMRFSLSWP